MSVYYLFNLGLINNWNIHILFLYLRNLIYASIDQKINFIRLIFTSTKSSTSILLQL